MGLPFALRCRFKVLCAAGFACLLMCQGVPSALAQDALPAAQEQQPRAPIVRQTPEAPAQQEPAASYDDPVLQDRIPPDQLAFLKQFDGAQTMDLAHDKRFKRLMKSEIPGWMFHYGDDMPLPEAVQLAVQDSTDAVELRDGRYLSAVGRSGFDPQLWGRAMLWFDLQDGIFLGAFAFRPTNGEPSPTVTVFSRQLNVDMLSMSQLPQAFADDLTRWLHDSGVRPVTTRYFIGDLPYRFLLAHDEDYCISTAIITAPRQPLCDKMNADAADTDLKAAYYLEQVNYATNATAAMRAGVEETSFIESRERICGVVLRCRIRVTRERVRVVVKRRSVRVVVAHRR